MCGCLPNEMTSSNQRFATCLRDVGLAANMRSWEPGTLSLHLGLGSSPCGLRKALTSSCTCKPSRCHPAQTAARTSLHVQHLQDPEPSLHGRDVLLAAAWPWLVFTKLDSHVENFHFLMRNLNSMQSLIVNLNKLEEAGNTWLLPPLPQPPPPESNSPHSVAVLNALK